MSPKVWYLVGMDLIGSFKPTAAGYQFVTMTDYLSKCVEAVPIKDKFAITVARGIYVTGFEKTWIQHTIISN